ncbi:MAG TPA: hypothetical protein VFP01_11290 [Propionibacteriaceae bacterium]|nr:hypothetical protein [Propionibacteriaceae bacterium]
MSLSIYEYLQLVASKVGSAEDRQDRDEVIRLLKLLRDTCSDKIMELEPEGPPLSEEPVETITHDLDVSGTADTKEPES